MNLNVGIFHDSELGKELGKSGTVSDIRMFNRKSGEDVFTFLAPRDDKPAIKSQIMSQIDAAIISFAEVTPEVGETIVMLDALSVKEGIAIIPPETVLNDITSLTKGTSLESYHVRDRQPLEMLSVLEKFSPQRKDGPAEVIVDHSFSVKGVGEVILGFVKRGTVHKHDKLQLMPSGKELTVRSIQMQDKDFTEAGPGSRVGLCIKGATVDEMKRGCVLCSDGAVAADRKITLDFEPNRYYKPGLREGNFHVTVGMQTVPVKVSGNVTIEAEKPIAYAKDDTFLLLDINAEKMHLIGTGRVRQ